MTIRATTRSQAPKRLFRESTPASHFSSATKRNFFANDELRCAFQALDREFKIVGDIQHALLPADLPAIPTIDLAVHYEPAHRAGGDYYDLLPLTGGKWGIFIGDASGHGTPAAVLMAVTHCLVHTYPGPVTATDKLLDYLNHHLAVGCAKLAEKFVTAFFGIYDPARRALSYSSAGQNPPRLKLGSDGSLVSLDRANGVPLGIAPKSSYPAAVQQLAPGDVLVFFTDGITEAQNRRGQFFGTQRLDRALGNCTLKAQPLLDSLLASLQEFVGDHPADDDRTIIVATIS